MSSSSATQRAAVYPAARAAGEQHHARCCDATRPHALQTVRLMRKVRPLIGTAAHVPDHALPDTGLRREVQREYFTDSGSQLGSRTRLRLSYVSGYVRPSVVEENYRDADGSVIEYGHRWGSEGPPMDSYSVDSHPERFAPLHLIAAALIDYLLRTYQATISDELRFVQDLRYPRVDAVRAVRLVPAEADAAGLTFVFTAYPGVVVHAGLLHDFAYPMCGCDACDETWQSVADDLESVVQIVASGGYREEVRRSGHEFWIWCYLRADDGSRNSSSGSAATVEVGDELLAAEARLNELPNGWLPWPRRVAEV